MSNEFILPSPRVKVLVSRRSLLQFRLRTLLILMTAIAVILGCVAAAPLFAFIACLSYVGISCVLLSTLFCGKGWIKGFAIGFTVPHLLGYVIAFNVASRPEGILVAFLIVNSVSVFTGLTTSVANSYVRRRGGIVDVPNFRFFAAGYQTIDPELSRLVQRDRAMMLSKQKK